MLIGVVGAAIAVVTTRDDNTTHMTAPTHDAGAAAIPSTCSATMLLMAAIDAGIPGASMPDAGRADAVPVDAVPADTRDAAAKRPSHPHSTIPPTGSTITVPSECDRSVDIDCDGIPDVR